MRKLLSLILLIGMSFTGFSQDFLPDRPTGMVNDFADILSSSEERMLENKLRSYRDTTTNAFVIATIESLQNYPIEDVALQLHNDWNIQYEEQGNGVLVLISEQDRQMRIEVGYGLEGAIPDIMANRIINDVMTPRFRNGDYYGGLDEATNILIDLAAGEFEGFPERTSSSGEGFPIDILIIFIIIIFFLLSRGRGGKGGKKHSLGSSGIIFYGGGFGRGGSSFGGGGGGSFGGFGGGGGFSSGGGGASGGW
ncbi:MAG: TPM domain-containing protein [Balneolaceae bacterium]